jgi:hypothetical protein
MPHKIKLEIPEHLWRTDGDFDEGLEPASRLYGPVIEIGGALHHLYAYQIEGEDQRFANRQLRSEEQALMLLNDQYLHTTRIYGRYYVIVMYPHGD